MSRDAIDYEILASVCYWHIWQLLISDLYNVINVKILCGLLHMYQLYGGSLTDWMQSDTG
jgi:hypothetical protein